jgi:hypothetical protein
VSPFAFSDNFVGIKNWTNAPIPFVSTGLPVSPIITHSYIRSEKDILKLVNTLIANTKGEGEKSGEDFWVKAEKLYYTALIGYIWYEGSDEEKNFITLLDMINASEAREDDEDFRNPVDLMFERLAERDPEHFAVLQYAKYRMAAGVIRSDGLLNRKPIF